MIVVNEATESAAPEWSNFLEKSGVRHHSLAWSWRQILSDTFGHTPRYLIAREDDQLCGVLPLFDVSSVLFGRALISVPYLNSGGIVAQHPAAAQVLLDRAINIRKEINAKYLELRHQRALDPSVAGNLTVRTHKAEMLLELPASSDQLFQSFDKKLRSQIRRPEKDGVRAESVPLTEENLTRFYKVFSENMRDLGTPVYPSSLFRRTAELFGERCRLVLVTFEGETIAAGFTIATGTSVEIPWASSLRKFNHLSANMALYWQVLKTCCESGYTEFNFGRSSLDSGTFRFKAQWGAKPSTLHWYYDATAGGVPDVNPRSPKYAAMVAVWQRLPLSITNLIGPRLTRSLP